LPIDDHSVDVIFATNALPREDPTLRERALAEWLRVLRPTGFIFCAMHNPYGATAGKYLEAQGCKPIDALGGQPAPASNTPTFQEWLSSG
jgi:ubiquinone/menaquinone biosynthesis C-methylase UbiE